MNYNLLLPLVFVSALPAAAAAQDDAKTMWGDLAATRTVAPSYQEQGGQVVEEWYSPRLRAALSVYGRVSFPSSTNVTADGLWYSDFFDVGWGVSVEGDLISFVTPQWGVGGYLALGWDEFTGQTLHFFNGDFVNVDNMDQVSVIVGGKIVQRVSPFVTWQGYMGVGFLHYDAVNWSGVDQGIPFSNEQLFKPINRAVFELGGRVGIGSRNFQVDLGFGFRWMGGAARGADVSNLIDPDVFYTFLLDLGLTVRF
jgi:hypothetical protein